MKKHYNTITQISVGQETDNPVFGECIRIRLEDECAGIFLVLEQDTADDKPAEVRIGLDEWVSVCKAVRVLLDQPLVK